MISKSNKEREFKFRKTGDGKGNREKKEVARKARKP